MIVKNGSTYFKYSVILIGIIVVFLLFRRCGKNEGSVNSKTDTVSVVRDTTIYIVKKDTNYVPVPYKVSVPQPYKVTVHDTLEIYETIGTDSTNVFLKEYISSKYYRDTVKNNYGYIIIEDTLSRNSIQGRSVATNLSILEVKETVTLQQPKRNILYTGFEVIGNEVSPLWGTGVNVGLKTKNDKIYIAKGILNKTGDAMFGFQMLIPIKTRKN